MFVVSDTNILSTLAAGAALSALQRLYQDRQLIIPPSVEDELQAAEREGKTHLQPVLEAISSRQIHVLSLSAEEEGWAFAYPLHLGAGVREAMALALSRNAVLLTNDNEAIRYARQKGLLVISLVSVLRSLWTAQVMSQAEVRELIEAAQRVERLRLTAHQFSLVFDSR